MYKRDKLLREEAQKRLAAIREFTDLGSGFRIAMRDLEIREPVPSWGRRSTATWPRSDMIFTARCWIQR